MVLNDRGLKVVAVAAALSVFVTVTACAASDSPPRATEPDTAPSDEPATDTAPDEHAVGPARPAPSVAWPAMDDECSTAAWPLDQRLRSLIFASLGGPDPSEIEQAIASQVGGIFVSSAAAPAVADGSLAAATAHLDPPPLVAVDEEGGRVQALRDTLGRIPSGREMAATMSTDEIRALAEGHGRALRDHGITIDFAPVVDVSDTPDGHVIGDRSFGATPGEVTAAAGAFARGLADAGVIPTLKHFPGHGRASGDSHLQVVTTPPLDELGPDLAPYRELLPELPTAAVMVGHLLVPGLTGDELVTTSRAAVTGLLRDELGFDGPVVTDDLGGMRGVLDLHSSTEAAVLSITAGVDLALIPTRLAEDVAAGLHRAVEEGTLSEEQATASADRVLRARLGDACA